MKYFITYHAIERLKERFGSFYNKQSELKDWNKDKGTACVKPLFDKWISGSEENRSYLNNSVYMLKLYDKYGYDSEYCFLEYQPENILFILTKSRSENHYRLVTLMPTEFRPSVKNIKYNNKPKKEEKHSKFVMDWYENLDLTNKEAVKRVSVDPEKMNMGLNCAPSVKNKLIEMVLLNQTEVTSKVSNSKTIHKAIIDDFEYEFIYIKGTVDRDVSLQRIKELTKEEKYYNYLQTLVTSELKTDLLKLVYDNITEAKKISNTKTLHKVQWNGIDYHFLCQKSASGDRKVLLQEEPKIVENAIYCARKIKM